MFQSFYYTKSSSSKPRFSPHVSPCLPLSTRLLTGTWRKPGSILQTDQDHFLIAVARLILASLDAELLRAHKHETGKKDHLQFFYAALEKVGRLASLLNRPSHPDFVRGMCWSHGLGYSSLSLTDAAPSSASCSAICCWGFPRPRRWSPMMATLTPDLVTSEDRANRATSMANEGHP